jgi:hypothetical protein
LTRDFRQTVVERMHRDATFARALRTEAAALVRSAEPKAVRLAAELGLIGGFRSAEGDLAQNHSWHLKARLRAKQAAASGPVSGAAGAPSARRKR